MKGVLDRRGLLGFWSHRNCVLADNVLTVLKNSTPEAEIPITTTTKISLYEDCGTRFTIQVDGKDEIHFRAPDNAKALAWVVALRGCGFQERHLSMDDFQLLSVIGRGLYGKVSLAKKKDTGELFAIKSIPKRRLLQSNKVHTVINERNVLCSVSHPFIVSLRYAFQSDSKFYLVLDYVSGGELFCRMQAHKRGLPVEEVRFYVAEIALALSHVHSKGVIYRDLKPENVLLDSEGHVRLTDFGLSKNLHSEGLTSTFCGTNEYLAPEVVRGDAYGVAIDWWTLGVLMFEMLYGKTPFFCANKGQMFKRVLSMDVAFPWSIDEDAESLIRGLLNKDPTKRFGIQQVMRHKFFDGLDFADVLAKKVQPVHVPKERRPSELDEEGMATEQMDESHSTPVFGPDQHISGFSFDASGSSIECLGSALMNSFIRTPSLTVSVAG